METRPTVDGKTVVKASRPGWIAFVVLAAFIGLFFLFMTSVQV